MSPTDSFCPYVGLQPYTEADREYFFGRARDLQIISSNLYAAPLTVFYGASGVGKSSVLLAGVVPHLREAPRTAVVIFRAWQDASFLVALKNECRQAVELAQKKPLTIDPNLPFDDFLGAAADSFRGSILILLDQFEEYFLYHPETQAALSFDAEFARAVNREEVDASFLISIREDGLSKLDRFRARIPNLLGNMLRLQHLDAKAAREAICKPLEVYNKEYPQAPVTINDDLVQKIIEEVQTGQVSISAGTGIGHTVVQDANVRIETPFLQLVMTRLWEAELAQGSHVLRLQTLESLGGAKVIVRTHLDSVMSKLKESDRETAAIFFQYLVTPSGTKIAYPLSDLSANSKRSPEEIAPILKTLEDDRVLRRVAAPLEDPTAVRYEIFHDVLAAAVLDWRRRYWENQAREKARLEERVRVRRLRFALLGAGLLLFVFSLLTIFALQQRAIADAQKAAAQTAEGQALFQRDNAATAQFNAYVQRDAAATAQAEAINQRNLADTARALAEQSQAQAITQQTLAQARELAASSVANLQTDPELGILLALNSIRLTYTFEGEDALRQAILASPVRFVLRGYSGPVYSVAFDPTGQRIVTASGDGTARIWDANTGAQLLVLRGHKGQVFKAVFSPDGKQVATAGGDRTVRLWDASTGQLWATMPGHQDLIWSVNYSPDGKQLVTASADKTARIWDVATGLTLFVFQGHTDMVISAVFSPDGKQVLTASADRSARIWDPATGTELVVLRHPGGPINSAAYSPDGKQVVTASLDLSARIWDAATGALLQTLRGHTSYVLNAYFSPDGKKVITASRDQTVRIWDAATARELAVLRGHTADVLSAVYSPDGTQIVSSDNSVRIWDARAGAEWMALTGHSDTITGVSYSSDGRWILTSSLDGTARIWDAATGRELNVLRGHTAGINFAAFSQDDRQIVTAGADSTVRIWDAVTGYQRQLLRGHIDQVFGAAFSPDGKRVVSAGLDRTARIWDAVTGEQLVLLSGHTQVVWSAVFSPDGKLVLTGSHDETARLWDVATGKETGEIRIAGPGTLFYRVSFSSDGKQILTSSMDRTARIWDTATLKEIAGFSGHTDQVYSAAYSPDDHLIVTASADKTARIFDVATGRETAILRAQTRPVLSAAFSRDGKYVVAGGEDAVAYVYLTRIEDLQALARSRVTRDLTCDEREKYLHAPCASPTPTATPR
ncbi:MAG TPA: WD40 repeat domain-containing protein [Anaerolineae bacterium]